MILADAPIVAPGTLAERAQAALGLVVFVLIVWLIGWLRGARGFPWRVVGFGIVLQFVFAAIVLFLPGLLEKIQAAVQQLLSFTVEGSRMVFGNLAGSDAPVFSGENQSGGKLGFANVGSIFAFVVLPMIVFVSMLTAILYHVGVLGWIVHGLAWIMRKTMGTSGAETLSTAANIFVGQTEAPLFVRPFLALATRSELMVIMVGGFSNIASGVLVVYVQFLKNHVHNVGGHLAAACLISAPATLFVSKLLMPETSAPATASPSFQVEKPDANLLDAATRGTSEGMYLAFNVGAMLIAFTALVSLINWMFAGVTGMLHLGPATVVDGQTVYGGITLEVVFGIVLAPVAWLCGVPWHDAGHVGTLLGIKTVLNEFIAYMQMGQRMDADPTYLSPRSALLATYVLCGFANFASVGIQIGGISALEPSRRADLSRIGLLAMVGGAIATMMGACVIGVLV
ncbi:NupC/NupG family nucleoside CNT transporter [Humisphaera borealis]|uniref:NupC/NupG family nucleoside CNT transporter n=1 Tax=Humisphaera borealis TaxID=2807512 RepID=A0A7M2X2H6_9BACT|nr:nucleoside transporter C-terminal domain-containing protein [Humisphaera borealis]QOV91895.1 NupC/NupG family nucleoside CNT transporter [Humisphaera borealis]